MCLDRFNQIKNDTINNFYYFRKTFMIFGYIYYQLNQGE